MRLCGSHIIQLLYPYLAFSVSFEPYNRDGVCLQRRLKYIFKYNLGPWWISKFYAYYKNFLIFSLSEQLRNISYPDRWDREDGFYNWN